MNSNKQRKSRILFTEQPLVVNTELATILGLNEAIIVQQISYWLDINAKARKKTIEGRYWTYNSINEWQETNFPFWSVDTIRRTLKKLEKLGVVISANHHKNKLIKSLWYTLDYTKLDEIIDEYHQQHKIHETSVKADNSPSMQNAQMDNRPFMQNAQMELCKMPKCNSENKKENNEEEERGGESQNFDAIAYMRELVANKVVDEKQQSYLIELLADKIENLKSKNKTSVTSYVVKTIKQHGTTYQEQPKQSTKAGTGTKRGTRPKQRIETMPTWDNEEPVMTAEDKQAQLELINELMRDLK